MGTMISYSQNGEDVILKRIFPDKETGFYIDIGASHPEIFSVTKHFYDRGWRGINVEPLKKNYELFLKHRPLDLNLNIAIDSKKGFREFFEISDFSELSTFSEEYAANLKEAGHQVISYPVETITGDDLFSGYVHSPVDFMKVDVEGNEYGVISSIDFLRYRPKVLLIEATIPNTNFPGWDNFGSIFNFEKWDSILLKSGYLYAYFDGLNRFYVRNENKNLLACFQVGLCVWDNYVDHDLTAKLNASEADRAERLKLINKLSAQLNELTLQLNELTLQHNELTLQHNELTLQHNELSAQRGELQKLFIKRLARWFGLIKARK
jgi:FkbM family methyltransferase